ncbi:MAG: helix-turn-helix domain-containing protein [Planctomycetes bacterium]|nr:helix-turn-helix domain-containing protein [Planctomycetota bacterium]
MAKLARRWGISPDKVLAWIRSGELKAIDASTRRGARPRYLIDEADIRAFEAARAVALEATPRKRRHTQPETDVIDFY